METDSARRGFIVAASAVAALPLLAACAAQSGAATPAPAAAAAAGADDVDFATWNRINKLVQAYGDCLDRADFAGVAAIFMPDGLYDYSPSMQIRGRAAIEAAAAKALDGIVRTWHSMGPPVVTRGEQPETFDATSYFVARHDGADGKFHATYGRFIDHYVRDSATGNLLIANRKTVTHMSEGEIGERYWLARLS